VIWLLGKLSPDFKITADFKTAHAHRQQLLQTARGFSPNKF
jgi:hypothetical protein